MKLVALAILLSLPAGCAPFSKSRLVWSVRDLVTVPAPVIRLQGRNQEIVAVVNTQTMQKLFLVHLRITRTANIQAELVLVDGDDPNAFAGHMSRRRVVGINAGMIKLIGDDVDEFAALLGHETAHWAKGHVESGKTRSNTIQGVGTLLGAGLGMAGVPAAGLIGGLSADLIEATYSRDDERDADALSIDYMIANDFDPAAAVRLHEKMLQRPGGISIPFLSSHPSGEERIQNLRKLIETKRYARAEGQATFDIRCASTSRDKPR